MARTRSSAARAIAGVAEAGAVGASIEDYDRDDDRIYEIGHAVERIAAASEAARALPFPFMLTGRAENHIRGNPDLDDTIARLTAYGAAGADVLYAPGLRTASEIRAVCEAVPQPVNVLALTRDGGGRDRRGRRAADQRRRRPHVGCDRRDDEGCDGTGTRRPVGACGGRSTGEWLRDRP